MLWVNCEALGDNSLLEGFLSPGPVHVIRGTAYILVVYVGKIPVALHPHHPVGMLAQAHVVCLPTGVSKVRNGAREVRHFTSLKNLSVAQGCTILLSISSREAAT